MVISIAAAVVAARGFRGGSEGLGDWGKMREGGERWSVGHAHVTCGIIGRTVGASGCCTRTRPCTCDGRGLHTRTRAFCLHYCTVDVVVVGMGGGRVRTRVVSIGGVVAVGKAGRVRWTVGDVDSNVAGEVGDGDVVVVVVTSVVDVNVDVGVVRGSAAGSTVVEGGRGGGRS